MKRIFCVVLTIVLCVSLCACGGGQGAAEESGELLTPEGLQAMYDAFIEAVDPSFAYDIAVELSDNPEFWNSPLGGRQAGSMAEHAAADWLVGVMEEIGLTGVEKVGADCDLWQFNDASFQISGDDKVISPYSYATGATPAGGITAEVVYVGDGTKYDYEDIDVNGKIVLVDVNQRENWWITYPMLEAEFQGAAAIMNSQDGGFSEISDDALNSQDICGPVSIPCVSISINDANYIKEQLDAGTVTATLKVDNQVDIGAGTTYNVLGKIEGKSSAHQIIIGGHYDTHFYGFQDDGCAVGLALAIAKAMVDSEYIPENDIVFCLHGAEEWGSSYTQFDWCTGSWEMINNLHPEWQSKTLAFINFELPAYEFAEYAYTTSAPEMFSMMDFYNNTYPLSPEPEGCYPDGILTEGYQTYTYSDDFSYYIAGVPSVVNGFLLTEDQEDVFPFYYEIYHSDFDTKDTYNESVMDFNIKYYGAFAIYVDQTPALYLDFTAQADRLLDAADEEIMAAAGADIDAYIAAQEELADAAEALTAEVAALNEEYYQAWADGADEADLAEIRARGAALTDKNLKIFKFAQNAFLGLMYEMPLVPHEGPQMNIDWMNETIGFLEEGDIESAFDIALAINNYLEWYAMFFSPEVIAQETDMFWGESNQDNLYWGTGRNFIKADVNEASRGLMDKYEDEDADFTDEIEIYKRAIDSQAEILARLAAREIEDMKTMAEMLAR